VDTATADTGWVTSGVITASPNWTVNSYAIRKLFKTVHLAFLNVTYTGSGISVPTSGDVTNTPIAVVGSDFRPNGTRGGFANVNSGRMASAYITSDGTISLSAVGGSGDIANGAVFSFAGDWLI